MTARPMPVILLALLLSGCAGSGVSADPEMLKLLLGCGAMIAAGGFGMLFPDTVSDFTGDIGRDPIRALSFAMLFAGALALTFLYLDAGGAP